ncbi:MAG TPA: RidA family protein [Verrucomicrobiae bacterium]|nr:RidA family protein [Verrucomicrobiae bacterium]
MAAPEPRKHFPPPGEPGRLPFSSAVQAGNTLYLSGHIGVNLETSKVPTDAKEEIRLMLDSFQKTLANAGYSMEELVYVQVFCSDVALFGVFNEIYRTYFRGPLPARAFIGSGGLLFGARFEIQGIAVRG